MRESQAETFSQDAMTGAATIAMKVDHGRRVWLEIEHSRLREIAQWLNQCADRQPMIREG